MKYSRSYCWSSRQANFSCSSISPKKNEKGSIILGTEKTLHKDRFNETEWAEIRRVWVNYQYELVLKKLRERKKENWETWEGVEKWRKELEAEIFFSKCWLPKNH